jgi:hypothetical protein
MVASPSPKRKATRCGSGRIAVLRLRAWSGCAMAGPEGETDGQSSASALSFGAADFPREALGVSLSYALVEALTGHEAERV